MNNKVVMKAIAREMEWIFDKILTNPKNAGKDLTKYENEIKDLYDAYMELRGNTGRISNIAGCCNEINDVVSIYELISQRGFKKDK